MSTDFECVIKLNDVSKVYRLYEKPIDRLKESFSLTSKKYHNEYYALKNVSLELKKGETMGIIGKNGSGKSTLLKIITGVLSQSSGEINIKGKVSALLELGAGFNPEYTGIENIYLNGTILGLSKEEIDAKIESILEFADIGDFVNQPVKMYSSGMFARLAFSVSINVDPDILIVDEALAVGDVRFQLKCYNKFRELKEKGVTILFVSHDINAVRNFCDSALWINEGVVFEQGDATQVTSNYIEYMNQLSKNEAGQNSMGTSSKSGVALTENNIERSDFKPLNRWGSSPDSIRYVEMFNEKKKKVDSISTGQYIQIDIIFYVSEIMDLEHLSIAVSIKNKVGLDLVVSTTFDNERFQINKSGNYARVSFEFYNYLTPGEYVLVAAIEDRKNTIPEYYDYIEGAKYFQVTSDKILFGVMNVPVIHKINYLELENDV
ncbi:ABC transporter ATP-binding protein [Paenibacillus agilis]|uniref:ABC transporter ATP-binding protein n=1 Tax=Paenibacillus agilis TaxID=3020863 RepID=A0A559IP41_9BACL|nr:ABC transporter ATP-binding protein [Paenibacillus agilis]TVX89408.1 ABC transporter ATP-binding protein [Paenibacillus agilis]